VLLRAARAASAAGRARRAAFRLSRGARRRGSGCVVGGVSNASQSEDESENESFNGFHLYDSFIKVQFAHRPVLKLTGPFNALRTNLFLNQEYTAAEVGAAAIRQALPSGEWLKRVLFTNR